MNKQTTRTKWLGLLLTTVLLLLSACGQAAKETAAAPAVTASPAPTPVITYTTPAALPLDADAAVPEGYTRVESDKLPETTALFVFLDESGTREYRIYGGYEEYADDRLTQRITGFYPSDAEGAFAPDSEMVNPDGEPFGQCTPQDFTESHRTRKGYTATGLPGHIKSEVAAHPGYYVYGGFDDSDAVFYPADEEGAMVPGALPVDFEPLVPSYTPTAEEVAVGADGALMLTIYVGTQSVVAYRAENGEWVEERIMICSTGRKLGMTPEGDFNIVRQYRYKKLGMNGEDYRGQYSSRIVGNYLFHSVPIGGKNSKQDDGKKLMITKYYERLGTPASGGCVRMLTIDAYWIYMHCSVGTPVHIVYTDGPEPPAPPALIYEEPYTNKKGSFGWDPTDPDPENPYHAVYEPELVLEGEVPDKSDLTAADAAAEEAEESDTY